MDTDNLEIWKNSSNRRPYLTDNSDSDFLLVTIKKTHRKFRKSDDDLTRSSLTNDSVVITTDVMESQGCPTWSNQCYLWPSFF